MPDQKRPSTIDDAIKMLDDALLKQKLPDMSPILGEEFKSVKDLIGEKTMNEAREFQKTAGELRDTIATLTGVGLEQAQALAKERLAQAKDVLAQAKEIGEKVSADVDQKVRENPWPVIGGIALGSLALGVLLAQNANAKKSEPK